jgi:hypothetical protein
MTKGSRNTAHLSTRVNSRLASGTFELSVIDGLISFYQKTKALVYQIHESISVRFDLKCLLNKQTIQ